MSDVDTWENYPDYATIRTYRNDGSIREEWREKIIRGTTFFYVSAVKDNKGRNIRYRKLDGTRPDGVEGQLILTSMTPTACIPNKASVD